MSHSDARRHLLLEQLEARQLLAALLREDFDPILESHFSDITGGVVLGAEWPAEFTDGNALFFRGTSGREATLKPLNISQEGTISFHLRIGETGLRDDIFVDAQQQNDQDVVVEASIDGGASWELLKRFDTETPKFLAHHPWGLAQVSIPASALSDHTLLRWRQLGSFWNWRDANWAIDDIVVDNVPIQAPMEITLQEVTPRIVTALDAVNVQFESPIDLSKINPATLSYQDLILTRNGGANLMTPAVTIARLSDYQFQISGLAGLTDELGTYRLTVTGSGINKTDGTPLTGSDSISWEKVVPPHVVDVIDVTPDPRATAVTSIDVVFDRPNISSFNYSDLILRRDGGPNLITKAQTVSYVSGSTYRISHLSWPTRPTGEYTFTVHYVFRDHASGEFITSTASDSWVNNISPTLKLAGSNTFVESQGPIPIAGGALANDADDDLLAGGSLSVAITANAATGDRLRVQNRGSESPHIGVSNQNILFWNTVIGAYSGGDGASPLVVQFNEKASKWAAQELVRAITFENVDSSPPTEIRSVQFVLNDGDGGESRPQFKWVNVQRTDGSPIIQLGGLASYRENSPPIAIAPGARVSDPNSFNFDGGKLTVAIAANAAAEDRLSVLNQGTAAGQIGVAGSDVMFAGVVIGTMSGGEGAVPLEVLLNDKATRAAVSALVQSVTFATLGENPSTLTRTLTFQLDDGDGGVNAPVAKPVRVQAVNDAPLVTVPAAPIGYVNNDPAGVLIAPTATVIDYESPVLSGGRLQVAITNSSSAANRLEIVGAFSMSSGNVMLGSTVIGTLGGNGVGATPLSVTFNDQATIEVVQQLLRSIRFRSENALAAFPRTISIILGDSEGAKTPVTVNVVVSQA